MIENVVISGRMGMAAFIEDGGRFIMSFDRQFDIREARFSEWRDVERHADLSLPCNAAPSNAAGAPEKAWLAQALTAATKRHDAFSGVLDGMNAELSEETRGLCIDEAEELLADETAATFVRNLLLGCPVPAEAALADARRLAEAVGARTAAALYGDLAACADFIDRLWTAWRATAANEGMPRGDVACTQAHFIDRGVFRCIVEGLRNGDAVRVMADATIRAGKDPDLKRLVPKAPQLLAALSSRLRQSPQPTPIVTTEKAAGKKAGKGQKRRNARQDDHIPAAESQHTVDPVLAAIERGLASKSRRPKIGGAPMQLEDVQSSVRYIGDRIERAQLDGALAEIVKLADQQLRDGEAAHFAKSLCSLATTALECGQADFALRLNDYARALPVNDAVVFTSRGEILRELGRVDEALVAYDEAVARFPNNEVARNGRAETLRYMGRLEEALDAYDEAVARFPNDVVARNGRAETLREMGRLDEALATYDQAAKRFPNDVVARNGRAETLREISRLEEALDAYNEAAKRFPNDAFARNGRAETLREMGRLEEALDAYNEAAKRFPNNAVARNGRAETLCEMGRQDEALAAYDEAAKRFPNNAVARNGRAETLREIGRLDEALDAYEEAAKRFPNNAVARNGRAETLREIGRLDEALDAYEEAAKRFPNDAVARNGRAETLREIGRLEEALDAYNEAAKRFPNDVVARNGRAETLREIGRLEEALDAYDDAAKRFPNNAVARNGRAAMLVRLSRFADARASLPTAPPKTSGDWIAAHIVAMSYLREGDVAEAVRRLRHGLDNCPYNASRPYFATALAVAELRLGEIAEVDKILQSDTYFPTAKAGELRNILQGHAAAMKGDLVTARNFLFFNLCFYWTVLMENLKRNLVLMFGMGGGDIPSGDEFKKISDEVFIAECNLVMMIYKNPQIAKKFG